MLSEIFSSSWLIVLVMLLAEIVLSQPQGYNYFVNQQRNYNAQRAAQAQRIQAQKIAAQNRYYQQFVKSTTTRRPLRANKADSENAKFLGSQNQEPDESGKTLFKKKASKLFGGGYGPGLGGAGVGYPCGLKKADNKEGEGRVFWDLNVYNVYPDGGCGFGGAPGGLADPYPGSYPVGGYNPYYDRPIRGLFQNWLGLFLPGGALSGVNRPQSAQGSQSDTANSGGIGPDGPNFQFLSDAEVMPTLTPNQLVSGVASTVNNVLMQLNYPFYG